MATTTRAAARLESVDLVRGAILVLMALDHVRDFVSSQRFPPEDLTRASAALFATRWVTHFCAPGFFLLAGVGIGLAMLRGKSAAEMSRYLAVRGLWLMILDITVSDFGMAFDFPIVPVFAVVLWTLGLSMVCMALLVRLPRVAVLAISLALVALHNLTDGIQPAQFGAFAWLWQLLHVPGFLIPGKLLAGYPLIPWVGVMGAGYALAGVYAWEPGRRHRFLIWTGLAATALFIALRATHSYGNPIPWTPLRTPSLTVAAFFNVLKYPPSLQFLLMTLGPTLMALALVEGVRGRVASWLSIYGKVPLFYYVGHFYLAHIVGIALAAFQVGGLHRINLLTGTEQIPAGFGVGLPGVYAAWILVVVLMYFPCRWFAKMKATRSDWWLRYL